MIGRPGPNIPLNLPFIQIIILHLSTPLFKRKVPIILKMQMKHEYDRNIHFGQQVYTGLHAIFLFIVSSEAKGTFSTPKNDRRLVF